MVEKEDDEELFCRDESYSFFPTVPVLDHIC